MGFKLVLGAAVGVMALGVTTCVAVRDDARSGASTPLQRQQVALSIKVDRERKLQTIEGLGFFGPKKVFWESPPYFDAEHLEFVRRLGASIVRAPIYWDGEPHNDNDDPFVLEQETLDFNPRSYGGRQFPWLRALKEAGVQRVIASVWSPPLWMKEGADNTLAPFCKGQCGGHLRHEMREEFAEYLLAYAQVVQKETGVEFYGISIQNEPYFKNPFASTVYTTEEYAETLAVVRRRFRKAGLSTKFFGAEHMGAYQWTKSLGTFDALLEPRPVVDAFAVHGYKDGVEPEQGSALGWRAMQRRVHRAGVPLWMTETSSGKDVTFAGALSVLEGLHLALKEGQVSVWTYFYLERVWQAENAPGPLFHLLRHYFSYVKPGGERKCIASSALCRLHDVAWRRFGSPQRK